MKKNVVSSAGWTLKVWRRDPSGFGAQANDMVASSSTAPLYEDLSPYCEITPVDNRNANPAGSAGAYQYRTEKSRNTQKAGYRTTKTMETAGLATICDHGQYCDPRYCHLSATLNRQRKLAAGHSMSFNRGSSDFLLHDAFETKTNFYRLNREPIMQRYKTFNHVIYNKNYKFMVLFCLNWRLYG